MVAPWSAGRKAEDELNGAALEQFRVRQRFENVHIYLWILKDYAWAADKATMGLVFGVSALVWLVCILLYALLVQRDREEAYVLVAMLLWLWSNFWWMAGEIGICGTYTAHARSAACTFVAALGVLAVYYGALKPARLLDSPGGSVVAQHYEAQGLYPRFPRLFESFRHYEYLHTTCWIAKDLSWNRDYAPTWFVAFFFTFALGGDFIYLMAREGKWFEAAHYTAQFLWVLANFAWALAEIVTKGDDDAVSVSRHNSKAAATGRWWAQVILILAMFPIALCYACVVPYQAFFGPDNSDDTASSRRRATTRQRGKSDNETDFLLGDPSSDPSPTKTSSSSLSATTTRGTSYKMFI